MIDDKKITLVNANSEFRNGEYKSALEIYKKINDENPALANFLKFNIEQCERKLYEINEDACPSHDSLIERIKSLNDISNDFELISKSGFFDEEYYLSIYPDVSENRLNPIKHYNNHGWREGRNPSEFFDTKFYLEKYLHEKKNINPLADFIRRGFFAGNKTNWRGFFPLFKKKITSPIVLENKLGVDLTNYNFFKNDLINILNNSNDLSAEVIKKSLEIVNKSNITFSVIVPMWNREKVIVNAIESILKQSYKAKEIILVDDGSDDKSCEIVERNYKKEIESGELKLIKKIHEGVSAARNSGLKAATSDLIAYLDSDNVWMPNYLLIMAALFSSSADVGTAYAGLKYFDLDKKKIKYLGSKYNRRLLLQANYIDMNVFVHRRYLYDQMGGFDEKLNRLVDWDLIIKYTKNYTPVYLPFCGVEYYIDEVNLNNISRTFPLKKNQDHVYRKHIEERLKYGLEKPKIAYVLWDWPALSQTFVLEEVKWLVNNNQDVVVYFKIAPDSAAKIDFTIDTFQVDDSDHLAKLLIEHQRNIVHSHFAYPTVTKLTYPACKATGIKFTFYAHAVDIFHKENKKRNNVGHIASDDLCLRVFTHGDYHRKTLEECGVPPAKVFYTLQAMNVSKFQAGSNIVKSSSKSSNKKIITFVGRFVEKKGLDILLDSAEKLLLENLEFHVYGYGPLYEEINEKINRLFLKNVILKNQIANSNELINALKNSDALVVPSVVAKNGDSEGFPTVIFEAMACGVPVIASSVSSVPHYLNNGVEAILVNPGDSDDLANAIRNFLGLTEEEIEKINENALKFLKDNVGVEKIISSYFDVWFDNQVDIFMVTFNNDKYENTDETLEIIKRVLNHTNTPFSLTIVDNNSSNDFKSNLLKRLNFDKRIRLILMSDNTFCGPSSNMALYSGSSVYAIYICSKEGFVAKHGWDRKIIQSMKQDPEAVMGGHFVHLPKYTYGHEILHHPDFHKFRGKHYALDNPDCVIKHIQGGIYILKRDVLKHVDGFNQLLPQSGMDVEFSYYLEARGYKLKDIPEIRSVTTKTLPGIESVLDENVSVAHPFTLEKALDSLDVISKGEHHVCNICASKVKNIFSNGIFECCGSSPFGRSIFKNVAYDHRAHRGEFCVIVSSDEILARALGHRMFKVKTFDLEDSLENLSKISHLKDYFSLAIIDVGYMKSKLKEINILEKFIENILLSIKSKGRLIFMDDSEKFMKNYIDDFNEIKYRKSFSLLEDMRKIYSLNY